MRFATRPSPRLLTVRLRSYAIPPPATTRATPTEADGALALRALAWVLGEEDRAGRFLALTGLDPDDLRARAGSAEVGAATLGFLLAHEPDLVACAQALGEPPARLAGAGERMSA